MQSSSSGSFVFTSLVDAGSGKLSTCSIMLQVHRSPSTSSAEMHVDGAQSSQSTSTSEDLGREAIRQGSMQGSPSISTAQPVSRPPYTSYAASTHACRLTAMLPSSSNSFSFMWSGLPEWHAWQGRVDGQTADPQALYEMPSGCTDAVTGANLRAGLHQQIRHCLLEDVVSCSIFILPIPMCSHSPGPLSSLI